MWFNKIIIPILKSPLHFFMSKNTMLMTFKGIKSGREYQVPMNYIRLGTRLLTTSQPDRTWWRNLRGGADVKILLKGKVFNGKARVEERTPEVAQLLDEYLSAVPKLAKYLNVQLDKYGKPNVDDVLMAAMHMVVVVTTLAESN